MLCVEIVSGYLRVLADVENPMTCAYVIAQPMEVNPFALSTGDAFAVVTAIGVVWAIAFGVRAMARLFF